MGQRNTQYDPIDPQPLTAPVSVVTVHKGYQVIDPSPRPGAPRDSANGAVILGLPRKKFWIVLALAVTTGAMCLAIGLAIGLTRHNHMPKPPISTITSSESTSSRKASTKPRPTTESASGSGTSLFLDGESNRPVNGAGDRNNGLTIERLV
ncbi:hypothetical protein PG991_014616 [Apiospora marii]|uniref:Uncharacterized protein n=1 Tax=Apiospora marii TaxID=335849 RepID=A0ABR1R421_9PEZI